MLAGVQKKETHQLRRSHCVMLLTHTQTEQLFRRKGKVCYCGHDSATQHRDCRVLLMGEENTVENMKNSLEVIKYLIKNLL